MMTLSERYRDALVADPRQDALNQLQADRFGSKIAADEQAGLVDRSNKSSAIYQIQIKSRW